MVGKLPPEDNLTNLLAENAAGFAVEDDVPGTARQPEIVSA